MPLLFRPHESLIRLLQERGVLTRPPAHPLDVEIVENLAPISTPADHPANATAAATRPDDHDP